MDQDLDPHPEQELQQGFDAAQSARKRVSLPSVCRHRYHYKAGHLFVDDEKMPARPDAL